MTTKIYDDMVQKKLTEIRGNKVSVKLSQAECDKEVAEIVGGAFNEVEDRTVNEVQPIPPQPKRRGRPPGSKNRLKEK